MNAATLFNTLEEHEAYHKDSQKRMEEIELKVMKVREILEKQVSENREAVTQLQRSTTERLSDIEKRLLVVEKKNPTVSSISYIYFSYVSSTCILTQCVYRVPLLGSLRQMLEQLFM